MTYRNKLLLKRAFIILGIVLLVLAIALLIGYSYLGRYVVYTENGAYFSFNGDPNATVEDAPSVSAPVSPVLVTGASILEEEVLGEDRRPLLAANAVKGILLDYDTLSDGSTLNSLELSDSSVNTLVLEMRKSGTGILTNAPVQALIDRAMKQDIRLVAMISCLDDSSYAQSHKDDSLKISGGDLWMNEEGSYWLDPASKGVQDYLISMINTLSDMGFDEVILHQFYLPDSSMIIYDPGDSTRDDVLAAAYETIEEAIGIKCTLGILVTDRNKGYQAFDAAEHVYVAFEDGSQVHEYAENHPDYYLNFITTSHDTRFDDYGKISSTRNYDASDAESSGQSGDDGGEDYDEDDFDEDYYDEDY